MTQDKVKQEARMYKEDAGAYLDRCSVVLAGTWVTTTVGASAVAIAKTMVNNLYLISEITSIENPIAIC